MLRDYNGQGEWTAAGIIARYREYAKRFRVYSPLTLEPKTFEKGDDRWVYPVMEKVVEGIEAGDAACIELGIDFISEDQSFPFGMPLKTYTARALRRAELSPAQQKRVRERVLDMLVRGYVPQEYREYAKLLRKIGIGPGADALDKADGSKPYVARYIKYFREVRESNAG